MTKPFRPNVAAILRRPHDKKILLAERIDRPGAWQLPQGGVDPGETMDEAVVREVEEELGIGASLLTRRAMAAPVTYLFPPNYPAPIAAEFAGQVQTVFLFDFHGKESDFDLDRHHEPEFRATQWLDAAKAPALIWEMKRHVVEAAVHEYAAFF